MPWNPNDREVKALLASDEGARYEYFIKRVADAELIWSLKSRSGWVLSADDSGQMLVPVWPHARYAEACALGDWVDSKPEAIEVSHWLDRWTAGMIKDGRGVAVFATPGGRAVQITPERLDQDLRRELLAYE